MSRHQRLNELLELLSRRGHVEVDDLVGHLGVSAATVRRDLDILADQQLLTRTHGGAVSTAVSYDLPLHHLASRRGDAKVAMARAAAGMVHPGSTIALNGGTTMGAVARAVASRSDLSANPGEIGVTVVTNALNIATELAVRTHVKIVVVGGVARPQSYELIGPLAHATLSQINADIAFLGVDAVDPERGAMARHEGEASINRQLAGRSERVVIVADHSKIGTTAFAQICDTTAIDTLLTDQDLGADLRDAFIARGLEVVVAPPS